MTDKERRPDRVNEGVLNTGPGTVNIVSSAIGAGAHVTAAGGSNITGSAPVSTASSSAAAEEPAALSPSAPATISQPARLADVPDKHSATLIGASVVLVTAGGVFMTVTALEPAKAPHPVWGNGWFDIGFALVALALLIGLVGFLHHFHRERQASRNAAGSHADTN